METSVADIPPQGKGRERGDGDRPSLSSNLKMKYTHIYTLQTCTPAHTNTHNTKFIQINLRHSRVAMATICQLLADGKADIALIQEPWIYKGQVRGLTNSGGTSYSVAPQNSSRSSAHGANNLAAISEPNV
jgi:hypothetical protein